MPTEPIAGVRYLESFLPDHRRVFEWALPSVPWDGRIKARKTASYGVPYNYAGLSYEELPFPAEVERVRVLVKDHLGFEANNCLLNYYPDGSARMGFHSDSAMGLVEGSGVAIVSLGAERKLRFRRIGRLDERVTIALAPGSLLFMDQQVQREWQHALPRTARREPRISLTFRAVLVG